ncbi:MAG: hypothetical protein ABI612_20085 [Betaproteobacteria bacterium]
MKVFLSVGLTYSPVQERFVPAFEQFLSQNSCERLTVGRGNYTARQPILEAREMMEKADAMVVLGFTRTIVERAIEKPGSEAQSGSLPEQVLGNGVVRLTVIETRIGKVFATAGFFDKTGFRIGIGSVLSQKCAAEKPTRRASCVVARLRILLMFAAARRLAWRSPGRFFTPATVCQECLCRCMPEISKLIHQISDSGH